MLRKTTIEITLLATIEEMGRIRNGTWSDLRA